MTTSQVFLLFSAVIVAAFALLMATGVRMHHRSGDKVSRMSSTAMTVLSGASSVALLACAVHWLPY